MGPAAELRARHRILHLAMPEVKEAEHRRDHDEHEPARFHAPHAAGQPINLWFATGRLDASMTQVILEA